MTYGSCWQEDGINRTHPTSFVTLIVAVLPLVLFLPRAVRLSVRILNFTAGNVKPVEAGCRRMLNWSRSCWYGSGVQNRIERLETE